MICPLCKDRLSNLIDEFYYQCILCDSFVKESKYYLNQEEEVAYYKLHNNDVNDFGYRNFTSPVTNTVLEKFNSTHLGLDYGCGTGPVISKMLGDAGYKVILYDPFFFSNDDYLNHKYDYIFSCEVFEHFHQPAYEIEKLLNLLKPDGYLIIMTLLFDMSSDFKTWFYRNDPTHVFIYTKKTIHFIAKKYNLRIDKLEDRIIVLQKI
ncbi:MAG: class I SAM-dependent methyltransferase [Candidatus Kapabacteria bacterium]|nr:class I SAM-dependent methyltransferase [Ignavibacteriota bacterium]MCW5883335.1 class I SAM-dependent methyltransferase [Candidatus Kapabacteria bacterium]